jgi:hypothetical protein
MGEKGETDYEKWLPRSGVTEKWSYPWCLGRSFLSPKPGRSDVETEHRAQWTVARGGSEPGRVIGRDFRDQLDHRSFLAKSPGSRKVAFQSPRVVPQIRPVRLPENYHGASEREHSTTMGLGGTVGFPLGGDDVLGVSRAIDVTEIESRDEAPACTTFILNSLASPRDAIGLAGNTLCSRRGAAGR